jgi:hypothetical protein
MRHIFTLLAVLCIVPPSVAAQSSVTLRGTVSETVALSVAPGFSGNNVQVVSSGGNTVRITFGVNDASDPVIRVPLLVRSNTSFKISANFDSIAVEMSQLLVTDVHATGALVSPNIVSAIEVTGKSGVAQPLLVLTGPRVSLGGNLTTPTNALQITVLIHLKPHPDRGLVYLTFVGSPLR